ncbi:hypothetical protein TTHERM_00041600 (macronuclear) [Tetrahymena thermophila SB210]|uniref:Uncharacterized protein n=1 Tax=Tetrahymena thermophila (strain SB210) TaxID=312017 RepID=Q22LV7_TETTS|nr:hypothetical protein TTHERM_00041600 [Tetrahymena thermophila SB210]EAR86291.2 hypothetical protein TTHERM_00041600 [Tetrahymena thermophila SB210]|eukprot:XP_977263.2 hypothetical protein TTHERM_00041600 [Tetrahymena thermophila SB210]
MQQGLNLREQKNIKNQLQKHREELELLELQIQQEQRNGLNKFQNSSNINISSNNNNFNSNNNNNNGNKNNDKNSILEERKAKSSLSRQQPQIINEQNNKIYKGQNMYIESQRNSNNSPVKNQQSNNSNSPTIPLNNIRPLGIRLSQAGQDVLLPNKNKVSMTMDEAQIIQTNQLSNLKEQKYNSKINSYKVSGSESQSPPYQRSGLSSNNYKVQSQIGSSNYQIQQKNESYPQIYINQQNQVQSHAKYNTDQYSRRIKNVNQYPSQLENRENGIYNLANQPQTHSQINLQSKQQKGHSSPEINQLPHNLKNLSIVKLPNEDEVHFDELNLQTEGYLIEKYCEFLNNDNDLFYLEGNFSRLYSSSIQSYLDSEQKESNAFKGALAVCFDAQNPQTDFKYIHPNFKVSLKKIANNPMIYAGLASQGASSVSNNNQDQINQSRILSNSKLNSPHSQQSSNQGFESNFNNFMNKKQNSQDQDSLSQNQNYLQGSREGAKGTSSQGINKSNNINRSYTNSTNTNLSFFNKKQNFQIPQISVSDLMSELQRVQQEYRTHKVLLYKIFIITKFKVRIDLGFLQISFNMNAPNSQKTYSQCIIHRLFISRIYRKLNYAQFIYLQVYNFLFATYPNLEKVSITLSNLSQQYLRFKQSIGFRLENIKSSNEQSQVSQQIRLVLKKSDFAQIFNHIHSNKKFVDKPGLDNQALNLQQNKLTSNKLGIPSF